MEQQQQQQQVVHYVLEHDVKVFKSTSVERGLEEEVAEYLDDSSAQGWKIVMIQPVLEDIMVILARPRQSKVAVPKPGIVQPRKRPIL
jgi:hypothetical protein